MGGGTGGGVFDTFALSGLADARACFVIPDTAFSSPSITSRLKCVDWAVATAMVRSILSTSDMVGVGASSLDGGADTLASIRIVNLISGAIFLSLVHILRASTRASIILNGSALQQTIASASRAVARAIIVVPFGLGK